MKSSSWIVGSLVGLISITSPSLTRAEGLTEDKFRQLLNELQPSEDELWRTIPWQIDLLEAQRDSVDQRKPIFIWAMDGHPLGCT